jgi:hypothetical protein
MTNDFIKTLPNGSRNLTYAEVDNEVSTYRDLLSALATTLASVAIINRTGSLSFMQYNMTVVDEVSSSSRYESDYSDYQTYYTGIYASYRAKAVTEYFRNVGTLNDTGLVIDIGYNVFLQIVSDSNRKTAVQAIIDSLKNIKYTPFSATVPFNPAYNLMDVLEFTDNQTADEDIAPITSINYKINDRMTIQCVGENPKLTSAQSKESKAIEGLNANASLSGTSYASNDFWIMINAFPNDTVGITDNTLTTEITITATTDKTRTQITWTASYSIDENALITVDVHVDDKSIYSVSDLQTAGTHTMNVSTGYEINGKGEHTVKIYIKEESVT